MIGTDTTLSRDPKEPVFFKTILIIGWSPTVVFDLKRHVFFEIV
jgi:hypothetical protein